LSAEKLHALTRTQFEATAHDKTHRFEGTDLREVLRAAGMDAPAQTRGALLRRVITAHAADGYIVAFTWAEIDPSIGGKKVYLVDRQEGAVLGPDEGPLRLVVPAESRPARWARQVIGLVISDAP
jgi:fructose-specific component phosphotransferase system IIB-like protein